MVSEGKLVSRLIVDQMLASSKLVAHPEGKPPIDRGLTIWRDG